MTAALKTWLADGAAGAAVCWIEFEAYARRVFANATPDWYRDPARFAAAIIQAHGVIPTQCLSIDILAPFLDSDVSGEGRELLERLAAPAPAEFAALAVNALAHRFAGRVDLVLALCSPRDLITGGDPRIAPTFDELDEVATAVVGLMRTFADKPLTGIVLEYCGELPLAADDVDAYEPILGAARHYGWITALSLPQLREGAIAPTGLDVDMVLLPQMEMAGLEAAAPGLPVGGGLTDAVWAGAPPPPAPGRLLYGRVPATATPETVLAVVRGLSCSA